MKTYISADMEGVAGVTSLTQTVVGQRGYERARLLMTNEVNAAASGAFDAGSTDVLVSDSHGLFDNIIHEVLDPRVRLVAGRPRAQCMAHGIEEDHDVALFVGYHAAAGTPGVLSHSFSSEILHLRVNGETTSEAMVNGWYAASMGVPVGLVTGDDATCTAARATFLDVEVAEVKVAHGFSSATSLHPAQACDLIRSRSRAAVQKAGQLAPVAVPELFDVEIDTQIPEAAELLSLMAGVHRLAHGTVAASVQDIDEFLSVVSIWSELLSVARRGRAALAAR